MKKLDLESFRSDVVKSEISKQIIGGSGEGTQTGTCKGTTYYAGLFINYDSEPDGDFYTSC